MHTGEDVPAAEYRDLLDAARRPRPPCSPTSASASRRPASRRGIEFVLEGLHLTKRLNKDAVGARATYRARGCTVDSHDRRSQRDSVAYVAEELGAAAGFAVAVKQPNCTSKPWFHS